MEKALNAALVKQLYSQSRAGMYGAAVGAVILTAALWQSMPKPVLLGWLSVFLLLQIPRHFLLFAFERRSPAANETALWDRKFMLWSALTQLWWGLSAIILFDASGVLNQFLLTAFVAGVTASVAVTHAPVTYCYVSSILLTVFPITGRFFYEGGEIHSVLGLVALLYAAAMIGLGRSVHKMIASALSLRMEKDALLNQLQQAGQDLEFRIEERTVDLKRSEEALRLEKQRFQSLADNSPFGMVVIQSDGTFTYANPKFKEMFGYDLSDVPNGREWFRKAYPDPDYRHEVISTWMEDRQGSASGESRPRVFNVTCKDGSEKIVHFRPVKLDSGEDLMTCEDITAREKSEKALRDNEATLRSVLHAAPVGIGLVKDRILGWSGEWLSRMTGYSAEELRGQSARLLYESDEEFDRVGTVKYYQIRAAGFGTVQTRWKTKDGALLDVLLSSSAIDPEDLSKGVVFSALDMTARHMAEEALKESEQKFRSLFEDSIDAIFITEVDGTVIDANQSFLDLFGYKKEEMLGTSVIKTYANPADRDRFGQDIEKDGSIRNYPLRLIKRDGAEMDCLLTGTVRKAIEGKILGYRGIIRDITDRKRAAESLAQSEKKYRDLYETMPDGFAAVSSEGRITSFNRAFKEMLGYEDEEIYKLTYEDITPREWHQRETEIIQNQVLKRGYSDVYQKEYVKKDGTRFPVELRTYVISDDSGNYTGMWAFVRDISKTVALQKQLLQAQKMEAVGTLAGGIAHDFNNLLQAILGYTELVLRRKQKDEKDYADLEKVYLAGKRGADLVQSLLMFSRKAEPKFRPVNLNQEILEAQKLLYRTIPKKININLNLSGDLRPIHADPSQIGQVLMNLGVNARDAMPDGGTLTLQTANVELDEDYCATHLEVKPGPYVLLGISDTGEGMDRETLAHIFEPFFSTKEVGKGTGLGLAMVYGIVKQHEGYIMCYSELGHGTTFKIYLPAIHTEEESETQTEEMLIEGGTETILLVEDEEVLRELGTDLLNSFGYEVITASNGKEALEIYKREGERISLVILDLIMPEMDGKQCLVEILRVDPQARILIASGYSENGPITRTPLTGAKGFVEKPYNMRKLLQTIRDVLDAD